MVHFGASGTFKIYLFFPFLGNTSGLAEQEDSFDVMMSQADPNEFNEKFDDSFEEVMSQADETDYYKESPKSNVEKWLTENQNTSKKIFKFKKRLPTEEPPSSEAKRINAEKDVPSTSKASMMELAQKRQELFYSFMAKQQEILAKEQDLFQKQFDSFKN